jgi:hypothetical protein
MGWMTQMKRLILTSANPFSQVRMMRIADVRNDFPE